MPEQVIIQKEPSGFTLHLVDRGRLEVDNGIVNSTQAIAIFAESFGLESPEIIPPESIHCDILLEGIEVVTVIRNGIINNVRLADLFAGAIDIMVKEANDQELVCRYLPVLNQGSFALDSFKRFFYLLLKQTKDKPMQYVFPEFSVSNPLTTVSASIGGPGERQWGVIRDIDNLKAIDRSIRDIISRLIGEIPSLVSADNYYLKNL